VDIADEHDSTANSFAAVAAVSTGEVWAVGNSTQTNSSGLNDVCFANLWNGSTWTSELYNTPGSFLNGVAAVSAGEIWAVGKVYPDQSMPASSQVTYSFIEEGTGGPNWSDVTLPNQGTGNNSLLAVAAVPSASEVWAVGGYAFTVGGPLQTLAEHWTGSGWNAVLPLNQGAGDNELLGVAAVPDGDVWAVGYYAATPTGPHQPLAEHWTGSGWMMALPPAPGTGDAELHGVAAVSASEVWAVGSYRAADGHKATFIERWTGSAWAPVLLPPNSGVGDTELFGVAAASASEAWAVGYYTPAATVTHTLIEHWTGTSWTAVFPLDTTAAVNELNGVAALPDGHAWAVGAFSGFPTVDSPSQKLVMQYP
jgi:hypothetical protein